MYKNSCRRKTIAWLKQRSKSIHTIAIAVALLAHLVDFHIKAKDQGEKHTYNCVSIHIYRIE